MLALGRTAARMTDSSASTLSKYVTRLEDLARVGTAESRSDVWQSHARAAVDGQLSEAVRLAISGPEKKDGAYFSGASLSDLLFEPYAASVSHATRILDPACGTGDLLAAAAWHLPIEPSLTATLELWGNMLAGYDIHHEFIRLAKARLAVIAALRSPILEPFEEGAIQAAFPKLRVGDGLRGLLESSQVNLVLMNPPFGRVLADSNYKLGTGSVSQAAVFLDACLANVPRGTVVAAILPDVLRSGSNYRKLRESLERRANVKGLEVIGAFSAWADVDVFLFRAIVGESATAPVSWWSEPERGGKSLSDFFDVSVGSVVPHRDRENDPPRPFLHARLLPRGGRFNADRAPARGFQSRAFMPPFAVVRRTSSPSDRQRIVATIIEGTTAVTIENHLLVVRARSSYSLEDLLGVLSSPEASEWLNQRMRCRHLTVSALGKIPWSKT